MPNPTIGVDYEGREDSISSILKAVASRHTPLLDMFADFSATDVFNFKHEWVDKKLASLKDTLKVALTSTTTTTVTLNGTSTSRTRLIAGKTYLTLGTELALVASIITVSTAETVVNITRAQRSTTPATYAINTTVFVGTPRAEGFAADRDDAQYGLRQYNFTRIVERQLKLSRTSQAIKTVGNENKVAAQKLDLMKEMLKELEVAFISTGIRFDDGSTNRDMGGFRWWATQGGGNNLDKAAAAISTDMLDDVIERYANNGGDVSQMAAIVPYTQQRKINALKEARITGGGMNQSEKSINKIVTSYEFNDRANIDLILSTDLAPDELYIFQKDTVKVKPLKGEAMKATPLAKTGDTDDTLMVGEYTAEFRNVKETLYRLTNLSVA